MKRILLFCVLLSLSLEVKGVDIVHDPGIATQNQGNEVVNLGHWISTEAHTLNTELNTLHQYENMVAQLARFGDPSALKNLPGIGTVAELYGSGQQLLQTYQRIQSIPTTTRQNLQYRLGSLQSAYSLQRWNPMIPGGLSVPGRFVFDLWKRSGSDDAAREAAPEPGKAEGPGASVPAVVQYSL